MVKSLLVNAEETGSIPGLERSSGKANGDPIQFLTWEIPWIEEPRRLQSISL